ncbi:MAG TPA: carboxypeptidase regulatory-like domain-containing protein [Bryobacteraceae bacterium]|nr:carboxypeptidase regulatory-like domain-containing protein [Bryobacteraceae bacterium]
MDIRITCLLAIALISSGVPASAQSLAGLAALSGTVRDSSEAPVPSATVTVTNLNTGLARRLSTNDSGYFLASSLQPGSGYELKVEKPGFAIYEAKGVVLEVGQNVVLNPTLSIAQQTQTITVEAATPMVDQAKTGVSQTVTTTQILNLPINGRRVDSFVLLSPSTTPDGTFGAIAVRGIPSANAFLQDGNDTTQQFYNENAGRTRISSNISQDSVQEFQVLTSGYSAEFGRATGAVVNTVTKSGSNEIHGTGYWFYRNQDFNARDRYAAINPTESRHQAGGSIGGPIRKDKLFYFGNFDITRRDFPLISSILNPQFFNASGAFIGTCTATAAQCSAAVDYFRRFFGTVDRTVSQNLGFAKLDWNISDRQTITASFNVLNWESPNGIQTAAVLTNAGAIGNNGLSTVKTRWARLSHTGIISSTIVNEFRFGYFKDRLFDDVNYSLAPPGVRSAVTVQGQSNLGVPNYLPRLQPTEDRFQFVDNLSITQGRHQYKFGFDIAHTRDIENALFNGVGSFTYGTITAFAQDLTNLDGGKRWQNYSQAFGPFQTEIFLRDFNFYAQDQFRLTKSLTLNYGLRYEFAQFAQPKTFNPDYPQTGKINEPTKNFAPRVGLAWSLNDKTVFRAGYGIFYARFPSATIARLHQLNGVVQRALTLQGNIAADQAVGPTFPNRLTNLDRTPPPGTVTLSFADPNLATPYTQQADFAIERELTRNMSITVSYLWTRSLKNLTRRDLNIGPATGTFTYRILDEAGNQTGTYTTPTYLTANRVDPRYSRVVYIDNGGRIWYDGLAVQFRRRVSNWAEGTLAYTWSHARDLNLGGAGANTFFTDSPGTLFNGDYNVEKGTSVLDQRHRTVFTAVVTPPRKNFGNVFANQVINGWQLSLLGTFASAPYTTPTVLVSGVQFPGQAFTNTLNGFGGSNQVPFLSRQSIPIDATQRVDSRLTKIISFTERYQVHLNFEVFNTFNRVSNTGVNTQAYQATAGVLRPVAGLGVGNSSGGFPDGTNARRAQFSLRFLF